MRTAKTQISLGISVQFDQSSLSASRNLKSLATHWAHSRDSDQTGWMPIAMHRYFTVWLPFSFNAHKISFLRFQRHVQPFRINREEVMVMRKQLQWRGNHNAKKIKHCDRHHFWVQHYWFSRAARSVALKWAQFRTFYKWLLTKYGDLFSQCFLLLTPYKNGFYFVSRPVGPATVQIQHFILLSPGHFDWIVKKDV